MESTGLLRRSKKQRHLFSNYRYNMYNVYINVSLCVVSGSYLQSAWSVVPPGVCQLAAACVEPEGEHSPGSAAECLEAD